MSTAGPELRVAYVITGLGTGGAEMMLEKLIGALPESCRVQVTSLSDLGDIGIRLRDRGVDVMALGMSRGLPSLAIMRRLVQRLRDFKPDVVHTWMYHANLLGGLAAWWLQRNAVMWGLRQSNLSPVVNRRTTLWIMRLCAKLSRRVPMRIACAGQAARDVHVAAGYDPARMVVIPNGFELSRFVPDPAARLAIRQELGWPETAFVVGVIGRFDVQKNHRGFVAAMRQLSQSRPDVKYLFAGQGVSPHNIELVNWLTEAGVIGHCGLLGLRSDVPRIMAALDVLALPSLGEAFPNVVGEAMACGTPCAVTDVGDAADIVGSCGRVVRNGDMAGLAHALDELLGLPVDQKLVLSAEAQARIRSRFDIRVVAKTYEHEYQSMLRAVQTDRTN